MSEYDAICAMEAEGRQECLAFLIAVRDEVRGDILSGFYTREDLAEESTGSCDDEPTIDVRCRWISDAEWGMREEEEDDYGRWTFHSGDASNDTDHRGFWGASTISPDDDEVSLIETARDLISQAIDDAASVLS